MNGIDKTDDGVSAMTDREFMESVVARLEAASLSLEEIERMIFERQSNSDMWIRVTMAADAVERCAVEARKAVKLQGGAE